MEKYFINYWFINDRQYAERDASDAVGTREKILARLEGDLENLVCISRRVLQVSKHQINNTILSMHLSKLFD